MRDTASDDVLATAARWHREGRAVAVATVVQTWGAAPRPTGSQMVVDDHGRFAGSVSGGCIEAAVVDEARAVIVDGTPKLIEYGVSEEIAWNVGLPCGGRLQVFIERVG